MIDIRLPGYSIYLESPHPLSYLNYILSYLESVLRALLSSFQEYDLCLGLKEGSEVRFDYVIRVPIPTFLTKVHYKQPCRVDTKGAISISRVQPLI